MSAFPLGARQVPFYMPGVWIGHVVSVISAQQVQVTIDHYSPGSIQAEVLESVFTAGLDTATGGSPSHSHGIEPTASQLAVGNRVLVGFVEGSPNVPIVLGRLPG